MSVVPLFPAAPRHPQAQVCADCEVRGQALFGVLDAAGLDGIHTQIGSLELGPDETVYGRGDAATAVFTVRSGLVRFERFSAQGERRIVRLAGRGSLIGQEALLQPSYAGEAVACLPTQLCRIPRRLLDDMGRGDHGLPRELMLRWQQALDESEAWMAELCSGPARQRVLRLLQRLAGHPDAAGRIWLPRRQEIGAMLDMTLETASRVVSELRRSGLLQLEGARAARVDAALLHQALSRQADG